MAATPMISMVAARAGLDAITAKLTSTSTIAIRTGALESNCGTADSGTLLATCTFSSTAFPASTDSVSTGLATATANAITSGTAGNTGTAGHFRCKDGGGSTVQAQGTVGTSASDMIINTTTITSGDVVAITSFVITLPDGSGND
jgi:hypothetical protein